MDVVRKYLHQRDMLHISDFHSPIHNSNSDDYRKLLYRNGSTVKDDKWGVGCRSNENQI